MSESKPNEWKSPLTVQFQGRLELPEDDSAYGTFWIGFRFDIGICDQLQDAITAAERCASTSAFRLKHRFAPELVHIIDSENRLVLGGSTRGRTVEWCVPAMSDEETLVLLTEAKRLRDEASFEHGWDNYSTARALRSQADKVEARVVHPAWRRQAAESLQFRSNEQPCRIDDIRDSVDVYHFDDLDAELIHIVCANAQDDADSTWLPQTIFRHADVNCWSHAESTNPFLKGNPRVHFTVLPARYLTGNIPSDEESLVW